MRTLVFSICARNYIGLARVLGQSIGSGPDAPDFRIYVAEGLNGDVEPADDLASAPDALAGIIPPIEFANMAFMYDVTEFCTALKAACFQHAFAEGYDKVVYMDPDVFVAGNVGEVLDTLDTCEILITPHLCLPSRGQGARSDQGILATGVYNLGFLGVRRGQSSARFLDWWHQRLRTQAFDDHYSSLFTDQRWIDFVPTLFPGEAVRIWRHLGCNLAPWNFHERAIEEHSESLMVRPRGEPSDLASPVRLVFVHFSGFDFRRILDGTFDQRNLEDAEDFQDLAPVYEAYRSSIRAQAEQFAYHLALPYGFATFADGTPILPSQRRLFRVWRERNGDAARPFAVGPGTFHQALKERGLLARSSSADLAADKATIRTIAQPQRLLGRARAVFRLLFRVLGRARFFLLVRSLNRLAHVEQHYETFRLDGASIDRADASGSPN